MIVVLADDLTGAAEIGGIAWRYGLRAEIQTEFNPNSAAGLLVVDTDTRACSAEEAARVVGKIAASCRRAGITQVFKKVDSVLRGPVLAELAALLAALGRSRALLVPANPSLGRAISRGQYRVNGQLLHQTDFANDPGYPATTADVKALLLRRSAPFAANRWPVAVLPPKADLPGRGIIVGETIDPEDVARWAGQLDAETIPAGAAEFFAAFLAANGSRPTAPPPKLNLSGIALFVSGSTSSASHLFCRQCDRAGIPVLRMPPELIRPAQPAASLIRGWAEAAGHALQAQRRAVVTIDLPRQQAPGLPQALTGYLADAVEQILADSPIDDLFVEGGATAAALVQRLGWRQLSVEQELAPGVVSLAVVGQGAPRLLMKPGSYTWPDTLMTLLVA